MLSVERLQDGGFSIREARYDRKAGKAEILDFRPEDYPQRKAYERREFQLTGAGKDCRAGTPRPVMPEARSGRRDARSEAAPRRSRASPTPRPSTTRTNSSSASRRSTSTSAPSPRFLNSNPIGKDGISPSSSKRRRAGTTRSSPTRNRRSSPANSRTIGGARSSSSRNGRN
ncbi:MAG: hypothetical protein MZV70_51335 [Desulfobacterales bacterium]|nr:hypothetical protein [Desulfobacterales bacterium]